MTRPRNLLIVLVTFALGVAVAVWLWPVASPSPSPPPGDGASRVAPPRPTAPAPAPAPAAPPVDVSGPIALSPATVVAAPDAPAGELAGRVLSWGDGAPVAGAEVTLAPAGGGAAASFVTAADGRFVARPAAAGRYRVVSALAAGFLPWAPDPDASPLEVVARAGVRIDGVVVYLVPALTYRGWVVDPDGAPVPGATVVLLDADRGERAAAPIADTYTAGTDGGFDFHAPDDALLEARAAGFAPGRARLGAGAQTTRELVITLGARGGAAAVAQAISGRVVGPDGAPVGGARVVAVGPGELAATGEAMTDADGAFVVAGLDPGPHVIGARADGLAAATVTAEAGATDVVVRLAAGARIVGRVVDPSGAVVPAPTVIAQQRAGLVTRAVAVVSVFDADGRFVLEGLAAGSYEVVAQAAGFAPSAPLAATAAADPPELTVTLRAGATLIGTLVDAVTRAPLGNGKLTVEGGVGGDGGSTAVPVVTSAITRADGSFELAGIAPGRRSMTAGAYGHHLAIVGPLELTDGARVGPVTVELTPLAPGEEPRIELAGVGAKLTAAGDVLRVEGVIPGGGAEAAGVVAGDLVLAIDGASVTALGMEGAIQHIRGPVGTVVTLTIQRGAAAPRDVAVTRQKIRA